MTLVEQADSYRVEDTATRARDSFHAHFGCPPTWVATAPGRVNLIGEFTDYNDGFVLPIAIERRTAIAAAPNDSHTIVLRSEATGETVIIDSSQPLSPDAQGRWTNYPKGVLAGFLDSGLKPCGFDALICSSVPIGAGLSSSAALEAAMATLLEAASGVKLDPVYKALLCQKAEHAYAGVPCGIMDPFISILARIGRGLLLDCRSREPTWLPFADPSVAILIIDTNVRHKLSGSAYAARRRSCETAAQALGVASLREATIGMLEQGSTSMDDMSVRCARHVIGENDRTLRAAECLRQSNWVEFGRLLDESHASLKHDFAVSCVELDAAVEIAQRIGPEGGVFGCRMTGGGFGGCAVALIETAAQQGIVRDIRANYLDRTGIGATLFLSRPAGGASLVKL